MSRQHVRRGLVARDARQANAFQRLVAYKKPSGGWANHGLRERVKHEVVTASQGLDFLALQEEFKGIIPSPSIAMWLAKGEKKAKQLKKMKVK